MYIWRVICLCGARRPGAPSIFFVCSLVEESTGQQKRQMWNGTIWGVIPGQGGVGRLWNIQVQNSGIQGHMSLASSDLGTEVARRSIFIDKRLPICASRYLLLPSPCPVGGPGGVERNRGPLELRLKPRLARRTCADPPDRAHGNCPHKLKNRGERRWRESRPNSQHCWSILFHARKQLPSGH